TEGVTAPARGIGVRRRAVVLAPLLALGAKASAAPVVPMTQVVPLALPEGINIARIKPVLELIGRNAELAWDYQLVPVPRLLALWRTAGRWGSGPDGRRAARRGCCSRRTSSSAACGRSRG